MCVRGEGGGNATVCRGILHVMTTGALLSLQLTWPGEYNCHGY